MLEYGTPIQQLMDMVRTQISDDAELYTDTFLLSAINSAIHIRATEEDLQRLFKLRYKAELATKDPETGKPAARWTLDIPGEVVGKERLNFIEFECYKDITPCFKTPQEFFACYKFPEQNCPGLPCAYTMEQYYGKTTIIFDRPLDRLVGIDAMFYIIPRYLTKDDTMVPISPSFMEAVCELVKVIINKEQTDFSSANARMQDYDKMVVDIANKLALQAMNDEPVFVNGWVDSGVYGG
jgi:hypothetical protein